MRRLIVALIIAAAPLWVPSAHAQSGEGGHGVALDASILVPAPSVDGQFPSARFLATRSFGPIGVHAGALHLTPAGAGLWAGVAGARFDLFDGPFQVGPFIEVGYGRAAQRVITGRIETDGEDLLSYTTEVAGAAGGGAGVALEWRLRPFLSLSGTAGYWYFDVGNGLDPITGPFFGGGLRFGLPGGAQAPGRPPILAGGNIQIHIEEPAAWATSGTRGIRAAAKQSIRVVGTVRDPSGMAINEVRLNGKVAALRHMDGPGSVARFVGFVAVEEDTDQVEIAALAADGRRGLVVHSVTPTTPRVATIDAMASERRGQQGLRGQRFAVVVGISEYPDPEIPDLQFAHRDAEAFYEFLRSENAGLGGLPEENIMLLLNEQATYRNMRSAMYTFLEQSTEDDIVYIYIAGHGAPNPNRPDDLFILPYDAEARDIPGTAFPMKDVNQAISRLHARHAVLLTDACHSGGIGMGAYGTRAVGEGSLNAINQAFLQDLQATQAGLAILTASEARQLSREGEQWGGGHGVFTWYLLKGLRGAADEDGDGIVRLGELLEYVRDAVRRETNNGQIPAFGSNAFDRFMPMAVVPPGEN